MCSIDWRISCSNGPEYGCYQHNFLRLAVLHLRDSSNPRSTQCRHKFHLVWLQFNSKPRQLPGEYIQLSDSSLMKYLLVLVLCLPALGQQAFFDAPTIAEASIYAGAIALDGWATQNAINQHRGFVEENPFARPFIRHGITGQVSASALGFAVGVG